MINWQSILSSFDDKPTLLEWLKKVQKALNESALTTVTVTQEKVGRVNSITLTFNFQDGTKIVAPAFTVNDGADGTGVTDLVNNNLTKRITSVTYNTTVGLSVCSEQLSEYTNKEHINSLEFRLPIMPGNGIIIAKKANAEEVEIKIDQSKDFSIYGNTNRYFTADTSASFGLPNGSIYTSYGDENGIPTISHKDPGGTYKYNFPTNAGGTHTLLSNNNVKNLFSKSIVGEGNIDLYRHNICFKSTDQDKLIKIRFIVPSSNNLKVTSLADLKTLLGNTFTYPVNGANSTNNQNIYEITETGFKSGTTPYALYDTVTPYPAGTWTDDVQTI